MWRFLSAKAQISELNRQGKVKHWENTHILDQNNFLSASFWKELSLSACYYEKNCTRTMGMISNDRYLSKYYKLAVNSSKDLNSNEVISNFKWFLSKSWVPSMENHLNLCKINENCHFFSLKWNLWITSSNSRHILGFLFNLLNDDRQIKTAPSKNNREKVDLALKIGVFSVFCLHLPVQSSNLSFSIQQGRIHGNPVADGWAGAVMQKPLAI